MNTNTALLSYIHSHALVVLATCFEGPWASSVYYVADDECNIYFLSDPNTRHGKHIGDNKKIAGVITDTNQQFKDKKKGVQFEGDVSIVNEKTEMLYALKIWNEKHPGAESYLTEENIQKGKIKHKVYKIVPTLIKFFNEELYGEEGVEEFK
ncbi:MAG: pyridoxamine 5'-phosphate oxidase family protein [bacterium]|nr:pyridoxamine 5'-phosphate oxidase family protein [bacterium]